MNVARAGLHGRPPLGVRPVVNEAVLSFPGLLEECEEVGKLVPCTWGLCCLLCTDLPWAPSEARAPHGGDAEPGSREASALLPWPQSLDRAGLTGCPLYLLTFYHDDRTLFLASHTAPK